MTRDEKSNEQVKCRIKIKEFLKKYQNCSSQPFLWSSMLTMYSNYVCQAICTAYFGMDSNGALKISASIRDLMGEPIEETATELEQSSKEVVELMIGELESCIMNVSWTKFLFIDGSK